MKDLFQESLKVLFEKKYTIFACALILGLISTVITYAFKDRYTAVSRTILVENPLISGSTSGNFGISSFLGGQATFTYEQEKSLFFLQSNTFLEEFSQQEQVKEIFRRQSFLNSDYVLPAKFVKWERTSRSVLFFLEWYSYEDAIQLLDLLVKSINKFMKEKKSFYTESYIVYLDEALQKNQNREVQDNLLQIYQDQLRAKMLLDIGEEHAFEVIDFATADRNASFPNRRLIFVIAFLSGIIFSYVFFILRKDFLEFSEKSK